MQTGDTSPLAVLLSGRSQAVDSGPVPFAVMRLGLGVYTISATDYTGHKPHRQQQPHRPHKKPHRPQ